MRILVVDDDSFAAEMTAAVLEAAGYEPELAENGLEALEKVSGGGIHLIISDMNMPLMDGVELFREVRGHGILVPFILLTGDDPAGPAAREPNLDACLLKDFSLEDSLPQAVAVVCARHGLCP